jgi:hypothetical protein
MRCPKGYRQVPPKSGNCVKNTTTRKSKSKSSSNSKSKSKSSSRKNRTVISMSSSSPYSPKFYDVAADIFPKYKQNGFVSEKYR